jgi:hypothetical protein
MMLRMNWKPTARSQSMHRFKAMLLAICLAMTILAAAPSHALANNSGDEPEPYDARIQGYASTVQLDSSSTALTWVLLIILGVLCLGVLFKDAKRSHLD